MAVWLCAACSASTSINVGNEADGSVAGSGGSSGFGGVGGFGGNDNALVAHIENPQAMQIDIVTISCAGECAEVIAVATGGNGPYTFAWNDGVTSAARSVCPGATTTYAVSVTDTAIDDPEFHYDAQTVSASVTAEVLECPDAGVDSGVDGGTDGGAMPSQCSPVSLTLASCNNPDGQLNVLPGRSLIGGVTTGLSVTGTGNFSAEGWHYEIWASDDGCSLDEKLSEFQLANGPIDIQQCITASRDYAYVLLLYRFALTDGFSLSTWNLEYCDQCGAAQ